MTLASKLARRRPPLSIVLTCEHAGNRVPVEAFPELEGVVPKGRLTTHRAFDPGALDLAVGLAEGCERLVPETLASARLHVYLNTRLVIDLNRSLDNPAVFSTYSAGLPAPVRKRLVETLYQPFRNAVHAEVRSRTKPAGARVVHVSVHSFTPVLRGVRRDVDIGFLYDPSRAFERRIVGRWMDALARLAPRLSLSRNQPYRGVDDGHTTRLRTTFSDRQYAGIELELNQRFVRSRSRSRLREIHAALQASLSETLRELISDTRR